MPNVGSGKRKISTIETQGGGMSTQGKPLTQKANESKLMTMGGQPFTVPEVKVFGQSKYRMYSASLSKASQERELKKLRNSGVDAKITTIRRQGETLYTLYVSQKSISKGKTNQNADDDLLQFMSGFNFKI